MVLKHAGGALAVLSSTLRATTPQEALVMGTEGSIRVHSPWWQPQALTVTDADGEETLTSPLPHNGYAYEAAEVGRCLQAGETESPVMPLGETFTIMSTLDRCRAQWGLRYPGEADD